LRPSFFINILIKGNLRIKMKALSQSEYGELRNLYESIYTPKVDLAEELLDEIFDELVDEYIEEGYSEEDAIEIVDEAVDLYIDEVLCEVSDSYYDSAVRASKKAAQGIDKAARQKRRAGQVRYAKRKAGEALKTAGDKVKGAVAGAQIAGSIAKDEARRAGRKAVHAVTSAPGKAKASVDRKKKGIKGFIKRQAQKVVDRMSEELEAIGEDSRRMSNKQHTQRVRSKIKSFGSNYTPPSNYDPDANRGQGEVLTRKQIEKKRRKSLRQEELEATGLFSEKEIESIMEADSLAAMQARREKRLAAQRKREGTTAAGNDFGHDYSLTPAQQKARRDAEYKAGMKKEEFEAWLDEAMSSYDRNRKRAAQRAAARNAARDAGKTGVVPGVGYVTPRRERETYVDSAGTTRHKSGAKMPKEEFELDENRRAARAAGGYKDDSKKQTDPSKAGFTGISNSISDIMRQNKEIEARKKK
jgi:hypothetical protein